MRLSFRSYVLAPLLLVAAAGARESNDPLPPDRDASNFKVCSFDGGPSANEMRQRCELLRNEFRRLWLGTDVRDDWRPQCDVVLHPTRASYIQAVGRNAGQTSGSSLIQLENGRIVVRRIDLLVDQFGSPTALPHELIHVVLADRFAGRQPPPWLDEGIATMADSIEKRLLHQRDCHAALQSGTALRLIDVLRLEQFATAEQVPAFYGQSLSLIHFLAERDEPRVIVEFVEAAMVRGYDRALKDHYNIENVAELERNWLEHVRTKNRSLVNICSVSHRP